MNNSLFSGIFDAQNTEVIGVTDFLFCIGISLIIGLIMAFSYMYKTKYTKSFVITLAMLPSVVCVVIMMVNGNVGAGVAVAGAFSLVRFRSVPGTAKEIGTLFLAMGAGLIAGMGYLAFALLYTVVLSLVFTVYNRLDFGSKKCMSKYKSLRITIPEDLDYFGVFDEIFDTYTSSCELVAVKTVNMGSLFRLTYDIVLKNDIDEKKFIDEIRCRNGNLEISLSIQPTSDSTL